MRNNPLVITIDGPAGSGKSTVARRLAEALDIPYLDTGAMYRALALAAIENNVAADDEAGLVKLFRSSKLEIGADGRVRWNGRDISRDIRSSQVTAQVSRVAALPAVRELMVQAQRDYARDRGVVTEGRDQGTVVFPDADFKFYLDADLEVRASRRAGDLARAGEEVDLMRLVAEIAARDRSDRERGVGPLMPPQDAEVIDSSVLTIEEVTHELLDRVRGVSP